MSCHPPIVPEMFILAGTAIIVSALMSILWHRLNEAMPEPLAQPDGAPWTPEQWAEYERQRVRADWARRVGVFALYVGHVAGAVGLLWWGAWMIATR